MVNINIDKILAGPGSLVKQLRTSSVKELLKLSFGWIVLWIIPTICIIFILHAASPLLTSLSKMGALIDIKFETPITINVAPRD